ncbi:nuclear hormone receptor family member nhr-8-like isoform X2 [Littorina saxatilis]|uniref:Nuclear hormone receptor HR96 n=2 Tax=Littorina saxatilis TaxID=31220 RepID=A0AAN9GKC0_9CAEN
MLLFTVAFEDEEMNKAPVSPDSTPLDLSPTMAESSADRPTATISITKTDPDFDPERSADREAVALAMVTDLTKATGALPLPRIESEETSEERPPRKKQRKRPRDDEKVCRVCGDKALAHNFDAITCESCKAFFRRNALRTDTQRIMCLFKGECPVNVQTRRFCPACRLQKCFTVGMKADLILDDGERKARMDKVSENRAKRKGKDPESCDDSQVGSSGEAFTAVGLATEHFSSRNTSPAVSSPPSSTNFGRVLSEMEADDHDHRQQPLHRQQHPQQPGAAGSSRSGMTTLHYVLTSPAAVSVTASQPVLNVPSAGHKPRISSPSQFFNRVHIQKPQSTPPPPHQQPKPQPHQHPTPTSTPRKATSVNKKTEADFQHVPRDILPSDPHMYWRLSEEEKTLLTQLSSAYQDTIMTLPERVPCEGGLLLEQTGEHRSIKSLESIFESSEKNTKQLINFVQRLGDFHLLREDDKIAVLQASGMRSVILRWTALYVVERNTWLTRFGECDVRTASIIFGHEDVMQEMAAFCRSTKMILKNDVTLFVLMHCLILFDPREINLVDRQLIGTFRDKYIILLKHYLESEYSFLYTERYLRAVLDKTVDIREVAEKSLGIMREFKEYIPPLMKQVLNLQENS